MNYSNSGTLYGIGVGPGDPELITLKGYNILKRVPVIFIPKKSIESRSYALSIAKHYIDKSKQKIIELLFPMTKNSDYLKQSWEKAAQKTYETLLTGQDCAFITEGDPFFFSTFLYVFKILQEKKPIVPIEVVPGITAMNASSCKALFPLTEQKDSFAVLPAGYHINTLQETINDFDTVVLMKVKSVFNQTVKIIKNCKVPLETIFIQKCGTREEQIISDIEKVNPLNVDYFSLVIIKKLK